jgi:raffinose/stachyose/melibiose transport system substrate-binding protein
MHKSIRPALFASGISIALLMTGCANAGGAGGGSVTDQPEYSGTVSILTKYGAEPFTSYFEGIADAYEELHPGVTVELIQSTDQAIKTQVKTMVTSKTLPDIYFTWTGDWARQFTENGLAADLTDVIAPGTEWGDTFLPAAVDAFAPDGTYWAVPESVDAKLMGYNKAIFEEAGVAVPESFDELLTACDAISAAGYQPIAFGNKDGWPALHYLGQLFGYNVPVDVIQQDFDVDTAEWSDPGYAASVDQFTQLLERCVGTGNDINSVLYTTVREDFAAGRAAMYYANIVEFDVMTPEGSQVSEDGFGAFQLPLPSTAVTDAANAPLAGAPTGYIVNPKGNVPLAVDFLKFASNLENAQALASPPYGQPSPVLGAVSPDTSSTAVAEGASKIAAAPALIGWLDTETNPDVAAALLSATEGVVGGNVTPKELLDRALQASEAAR